MNTDFGIVLTTYSGDFYLTKGLLASIGKFMPQMPICIIQDGDFSLDEVKRTYNITHVIKKQDVKNDFLRENCFGSRCTNMIAFWECPFEKFLYLDSDVVLWGNILRQFNLQNTDFIHNEPHEPYTELVYREQYFDPNVFFQYTEYFDWKDCHFFNSGVFVAKRGIFDIEEFKQLQKIWRPLPDETVPSAPQTYINVLVFRNKLKGKIHVQEGHLQTVVPVRAKNELDNEFIFSANGPVVTKDTAIHWAGAKPVQKNKTWVFISPSDYFRKLHLQNIQSIWRFFPKIYFYYEENRALLNQYYGGSLYRYAHKKLQNFLKKESQMTTKDVV